MAKFNVGDKVIGKKNNGLQLANEFTMFEVIGAENNTVDIMLVASVGGDNMWKAKKGGDKFYGIEEDRFELATNEMVLEAFPPKVSKAKVEQSCNLGSGFKIVIREDGSIESNINLGKQVAREVIEDRIDALKELMNEYNSAKQNGEAFNFTKSIGNAKYAAINNIFDKNALKDAFSKLIKFFSEFQFAPSLRFVNTLMHKCAISQNEGIEYIANYFNLNTSPYKDSVVEKMESAEFKQIIGQLSMIEPSRHINTRLKTYYGAPGAGKTYTALKESEGRVVLCHSGMLPGDILEDFSFTDGKPGFHKSIFCKCMEEGKTITMDEFNLLPWETIRFLQGILDDKESFTYKGETIHIKEGFNVIGTMNLIQNGSAFGLSEALTDRCSDIKEFVLSADDLMRVLE